MSKELVTITGVEEVCRDLGQMPAALVIRSFYQGLSSSGGVLVEELLARTPERHDENARPEDQIPLRDDIQAQITLDSNLRGGFIEVGFGRTGYIANWLEYGHKLVGHKPGNKVLGAVPRTTVGAAAFGFMRRAGDAGADRAIAAFIDTVIGSIEEGL